VSARTVERTEAAWHALSADEALRKLESGPEGLSSAVADARRAAVGPNLLPSAPPHTLIQIVLEQFKSPLIYILGAAAGVSVLLGEFTDAGFIVGVLAVNALIGTWQEWRAEQGTQALQKFLRIRAAVLRDGQVLDRPAEDLVPGDVVLLESGNRVPADLRLLSAAGFEVDESLLTGESAAVLKDAAWRGPAATTAGDRRNLAHAGSVVVRGRARGVVAATGRRTLIGDLATDVMGAGAGKPPLVVRMERFSRTVAWGVLIAAGAVSVLGVVVRGLGAAEMFFFAVALAVSAIPEGLPVAMTVALSIATARMARRHVIVRRLAAVEGLGSCTLIASDKTGTLTCNELTVRQLRLPDGTATELTGEGYAPAGELGSNAAGSAPFQALLRAGVLCNEAELRRKEGGWTWRGDPTDIALLSAGFKAGMDRAALLGEHPQTGEIPFEPELRFAATFHRSPAGPRVVVKGAHEQVLEMCEPSGFQAERARDTAQEMAAAGFRVLAFAEGPASESGPKTSRPEGLSFLGFAGMLDPLRPGVRGAVEDCRSAGIRVAMITGDHPVTALAIARDLGMAERPEEVMTGAELEQVPPDQRPALIGKVRVFARVAPRQKLELVEAAQKAGHFVAVTGDGVNDAPALRQANIGVAMGKSGTDVAREASEIVVADDNFVSIVSGVEEGRVAYDNLRKVIYLLISTGAAEILMAALSILFGLPLPLLPVQLLWLNLVTNGIQDVALAFEPSEGDVMKRRPRPPGEGIFNRLMIERTVIAAAVMGIGAFGVFAWLLANGWSEGDARNLTLLLMVLFENIHIGNCRSETKSALRHSPLRSPLLLMGALTALGVHLLAMITPVGQKILKTAPIAREEWAAMIPVALTVFLAMEIHKMIWRRRHPPEVGRA
jgi:Ca2+-transporting ATPase